MKGFIKGFNKYFSNMFEEKEPEMQIGGPTDVKHVAHIGLDGPAANKPAWMNEFNANTEVSSSQIDTNKAGKPPISAAGNQEQLPPEKPKKSRRKASVGGESSPKDKKNRRNRASAVSMESPGREQGRGRRKKGGASMDSMDTSGMNEMDSDQTKKNRRRKN